MRILRLLTLFIVVVSLVSLAACSKPLTRLKDGGYSPSDVKGVDGEASAMVKTVTMTLERGNAKVSFGTSEGEVNFQSKQTLPEKWPTGCGHSLELMKFAGSLAMGKLALAKPVLVVGCPVESGTVVLREAGEIDGENPCEGTTGPCIIWSPK